jgi:hypothetical protein
MLDRVPMNVIDVSFEISFIPNRVLPESPCFLFGETEIAPIVEILLRL